MTAFVTIPGAGRAPQVEGRGLGQKAYDRLVAALEEGTLTANGRIVETELAAWLGMSRTPVREALQRLQSEGVLVHAPRNGLTVAQLGPEDIVQLYRTREVLEGAAAAFAAQHASDAEIAILRSLCDAEPEVAADPVLGARHNKRFHQSVYRATHNIYLQRSLGALTTSLALLGNYTRLIAGRADTARREHKAIIDAIASRDQAKAEQVARLHIRSAQQARLREVADLMAVPPPEHLGV